MYIQITSKCNMFCSHCCYSCGKNGKHASIEMINAAIDLNDAVFGSALFIGGGEPTLHPKFWEIFGIFMGRNSDGLVGIITNGTNAKTSIRLAELARDGAIFAALSLDKFHFPRPDKRVEKAFGERVRSVNYECVSPVGRAKRDYYMRDNKFHCVCEDIFVSSTGDVYPCGCRKFKFGNVIKDLGACINAFSEYNDKKYDILDSECVNESKESSAFARSISEKYKGEQR